MSIKRQLSDILEGGDGSFISGSELAERLGVTRAAVWKSIQSLEDEGYIIERSGRGYRLGWENDAVSASAVRRELGVLADEFTINVLQSVDSTNTWIKERADKLPQWYALIAGEQTGGRGRLGRTFFSPAGTGLYISVLLRPQMTASEATLVTTASAVAVCRAAEEVAGVRAGIKWVNDVLVEGRKICGILTEASFNMEDGSISYAIPGVGINVYEPEGGFPAQIRDVAGALLPRRSGGMRARLAAGFLRNFREIYLTLESRGFVEEYRARSVLLGKTVNVIKPRSAAPALAVDIDRDCGLVVEYPDGRRETLTSGEVTIRPANSEDYGGYGK